MRTKLVLLATRVSFILIGGTLIIFIVNFIHSRNVTAGNEKKELQLKNTVEVSSVTLNPSGTVHTPKLKYQNSVNRIGYVDLTNQGIMYISSGTLLASEGSIVTAVGGTTENNGNLYLKGDWFNNGTYTKDNGKVIFWDIDDQLIDGSSPTDFYDAEINKSPGNVYLNTNTTISNNLNLLDGRIDLNLLRLTIANSATNAITYTNGYLVSENVENQSKVQWNIGSTTGAHVIPFGTLSNVVIPLTLNLTAGNIGNVVASTYGTLANNTPLPTSPDSVLHIRDQGFNNNSANMVDRYWQIDKTGGTGTLTITFTYSAGEEPANGEANLVAQYYSVGYKAWNAPLPSQSSDVNTNTVIVPGVSNFGPWAISRSVNPLPIELISFTAKMNSINHVDIQWSTASETNNNYFTIQRSKDTRSVEDIENIPGAGNSSSTKYYHTEDANPYSGDSYYRLKQTDYDGKFKTSKWVHVSKNENLENVFTIEKIYPNPFNEEFHIDFNTKSESEAIIQLVNYSGQIVFKDNFRTIEGNNTYFFQDKNNLPTGNYVLNIFFMNELKSVKIIKKN